MSKETAKPTNVYVQIFSLDRSPKSLVSLSNLPFEAEKQYRRYFDLLSSYGIDHSEAVLNPEKRFISLKTNNCGAIIETLSDFGICSPDHVMVIKKGSLG